jgi:hypothetical protein
MTVPLEKFYDTQGFVEVYARRGWYSAFHIENTSNLYG